MSTLGCIPTRASILETGVQLGYCSNHICNSAIQKAEKRKEEENFFFPDRPIAFSCQAVGTQGYPPHPISLSGFVSYLCSLAVFVGVSRVCHSAH